MAVLACQLCDCRARSSACDLTGRSALPFGLLGADTAAARRVSQLGVRAPPVRRRWPCAPRYVALGSIGHAAAWVSTAAHRTALGMQHTDAPVCDRHATQAAYLRPCRSFALDAKLKRIQRGTVICQQGKPQTDGTIYILISGTVQVQSCGVLESILLCRKQSAAAHLSMHGQTEGCDARTLACERAP